MEKRQRGFSLSSSSSSSSLLCPLTSLSLGLLPSFVPPQVLSSISQLPEVQTVLKHFAQPSQQQQQQEDSLHCAIGIFHRMEQGGKEHQALLALLSEY